MFDKDAAELNAKADRLEIAFGIHKLECSYCADVHDCPEAWMVDPLDECSMFIPREAKS